MVPRVTSRWPQNRTIGAQARRWLILGLVGCLLAGGQGSSVAADPPDQGSKRRLGDAWSDPANPVVKRFKGERLDLWSLKKPGRPAVPAVRQQAAIRNPIDAFIAAKQESTRLHFSREADRPTLIRRLTFDLWGLPPSPEDVQRFVADAAPDAYERLVERLLASPNYGERWGRHWLDVVRYADTEGFERDEYRPTAWRYRDYVVRAFNRDEPFDQFIREQLAGDELRLDSHDPRRAEAIIATGYLRLGPYDSTAALFVEDKKGRDYLMADMVSTTGSAFLGMTLACCQCHDHKHDPLLQADHFRLRAFFAAVKFKDDEYVESEAERARRAVDNAALDAEIGRLKAQAEAVLEPARRRLRERRLLFLPTLVPPSIQSNGGPLGSAAIGSMVVTLTRVPVKESQARDVLPATEKERYEALARRGAYLEAKKWRSTALAMTDSGSKAPPTPIFAQGDIQRPLQEVPPGYFSVLDPNPAPIPTSPTGTTTGRRLALANWIASPENPLTARVLVNRLWQHHFGVGIVASPNDFGFSGSPPTHPELLDWLATEFMRHGWSIKHLHRLILLSATYRQVSTVDREQQKRDPENRTYWRQNIQRNEAEVLRDSYLAVAGVLRSVHGGPPRWPEVPVEALLGNPVIFESVADMEGRLEDWYVDAEDTTNVRTLFTIQKRSVQLPLLQTFDLPDPVISCGRRSQSTVAPQALALLNSAFGTRMARGFAARVAQEAGSDPRGQIDRAFWLALGRAATPAERKTLHDLWLRHCEIHRHSSARKGPPPELAALADVCRVLLNLNEFLYVD